LQLNLVAAENSLARALILLAQPRPSMGAQQSLEAPPDEDGEIEDAPVDDVNALSNQAAELERVQAQIAALMGGGGEPPDAAGIQEILALGRFGLGNLVAGANQVPPELRRLRRELRNLGMGFTEEQIIEAENALKSKGYGAEDFTQELLWTQLMSPDDVPGAEQPGGDGEPAAEPADDAPAVDDTPRPFPTLADAVKQNDISAEVMQQVLENTDPEQLSELDEHGRLPLHYICLNRSTTGSENITMVALVHPDAIVTRDKYGMTPLAYLINASAKPKTYIGLDVHSHPLSRSSRTSPWYCDVCRKSGQGDRYRCRSGCDFDMCGHCWKTHSAKRGPPKEPPKDLLENICALIDVDPACVAIADPEGKIPYVAARQYKCSAEILEFLQQKSSEQRLVWAGGDEAGNEGTDSHGVHILLELQAEDSMHAVSVTNTLAMMSKRRDFCLATKLFNLPFSAAQIKSMTVNSTKWLGFLLTDGRIFRMQFVLAELDADASSTPVPTQEEHRLERAKMSLRRFQQGQQQLEVRLERARQASYSCTEEEIQQLIMITTKSRDDVESVLHRINPRTTQPPGSEQRMMVCMNVLCDIPPDVQGGQPPYFDGDDLKRVEYEMKRLGQQTEHAEEEVRKWTAEVGKMKRKRGETPQKSRQFVNVHNLSLWQSEIKFTHLVSSLTSLKGLGEDGILYQWPYIETTASGAADPRALELCFDEDPIESIDSSNLRTTVRTRSGKFASWMDECCHELIVQRHNFDNSPSLEGQAGVDQAAGSKLKRTCIEVMEHAATDFALLDAEKGPIVDFGVSDYGTIAVTKDGKAFWWGMRPWPMRRWRSKSMRQQHEANDLQETYRKYADAVARKQASGLHREGSVLRGRGNSRGRGRSSSRGRGARATKDTPDKVVRSLDELIKIFGTDDGTTAWRQINLYHDDGHEPESAAGQAIMELHRAYSAVCSKYKKGDSVVVGGANAGLSFSAGAFVAFTQEGGVVSLGKLVHLAPVDSSSPIKVVDSSGKEHQRELKDIVILELEQCAQTVTVARVLPQDGTVVESTQKTLEMASITPTTHWHSEYDSVLSEPVCIFDPASLKHCGEGLTSSGWTAEQLVSMSVQNVAVSRWQVSLTLTTAVMDSFLSLTCDLETAKWTIRPECLQSDGSQSCLSKSMNAWLHIQADTFGFLSVPGAAGLPAVTALAAGPLHPEASVVAAIAFSSSEATVSGNSSCTTGWNGCNALHEAVRSSSMAVKKLLTNGTADSEQASPSDISAMLTGRDNDGATPFFSALRRKDMVSATLILQAVQSNGCSLQESVLRCDIFGTPPLHAFFGLCHTKQGDKSTSVKDAGEQSMEPEPESESSCVQMLSKSLDWLSRKASGKVTMDSFSKLLDQLALSEADSMLHAFATARNNAGKSLIAAFVTAAVADEVQFSPPADVAGLLLILIEKGNAIEMAVSDMGESDLDLFVMRLEKCVKANPACQGLGPAIGRWIQSHPGELASRLVASAVRVYCVAVKDTNLNDHEATFFMTLMSSAASISVLEFAHAAAGMIEAIRSGLPCSPLPKIDAQLVTKSSNADKVVDCGILGSLVGDVVAFNADQERLTVKADVALMLHPGDVVRVKASADSRLIPAGMIGEVLGIHPHGELCAVAFTNGEDVGIEDEEFDEEYDEEEFDEDGDDMDGGMLQDLGVVEIRCDQLELVDEKAEAANEAATAAAKDVKTERSLLYRACVRAIVSLASAVDTTVTCADLDAASGVLESSWRHIFDCCDIAEATLAAQAKAPQPSGHDAVAPIKVMDAALGLSYEAPTEEQYYYIAIMLDAAVGFKEVVADVLEGSPDDGTPLQAYGASLVRGISLAQPVPSFYDAWSSRRRRELLKRLDIDWNPRNADASSDTFTRSLSAGDKYTLRTFPVLKMLYRWQKTIEWFSSMCTDRTTIFRLLKPYEEKADIFRARMAERVRNIPRNNQLMLKSARGEKCADSLILDFESAYSKYKPKRKKGVQQSPEPLQPVLSLLFHEKSGLVGEKGEGKGVIMEIVHEFARCLKANIGSAAGVVERAVELGMSEDERRQACEQQWWLAEPFARMVISAAPVPEPDSLEPAPVPRVPESEFEVGEPEPDSSPSREDLTKYRQGKKGKKSKKSMSKDDLAIQQRRKVYRALGICIGLCLLHGGAGYELRFPLYFCRHVYKFLLGRPVHVADFAYVDSEKHKSMLRMVTQEITEAEWELMDLTMDDREDGEPVTAVNAREYITRKAKLEMIGRVENELTAMRDGLFQVLRPDDLEDITSDDLQLLLSGTGGFLTVEDFRRATKFVDSRSADVKQATPDRLLAFEARFWAAIELMSTTELLSVASYATANDTQIQTLVVCMRDPCNGLVSPINARTCTNEIGISDDDISAEELKNRMLEAQHMSEILGFDII
jgi:hypothetical protein